ncbi:hypothetical protein WAI453_007425 [Rhynchosporium graminicola]
MTSLGLTVADADGILDKVQVFDDGSRYERLRPITDFRKDIGVARILYLCRRDPNGVNSTEDEEAEETLVMKVKVQVPCAEMKDPIDGPNTETAAELLESAIRSTDIDTDCVFANTEIWSEGFAPYDRGLRNILWDEETGQCSIIDFEHYHPAQDSVQVNEKEEMELWGIMRRPALDWYSEWAVSAPPRKAR